MWQQLDLSHVKSILLALRSHSAHLAIVETLRDSGYAGIITATATYRDQADELAAGATTAYALVDEAGREFADLAQQQLTCELPENLSYEPVTARVKDGVSTMYPRS